MAIFAGACFAWASDASVKQTLSTFVPPSRLRARHFLLLCCMVLRHCRASQHGLDRFRQSGDLRDCGDGYFADHDGGGFKNRDRIDVPSVNIAPFYVMMFVILAWRSLECPSRLWGGDGGIGVIIAQKNNPA